MGIQVVLSLRFHEDAMVRRALMYVLSRVVLAVLSTRAPGVHTRDLKILVACHMQEADVVPCTRQSIVLLSMVCSNNIGKLIVALLLFYWCGRGKSRVEVSLWLSLVPPPPRVEIFCAGFVPSVASSLESGLLGSSDDLVKLSAPFRAS